MAARRAHNPEVGGSSPPPATTADVLKKSSAFFVLLPGPCRALFLPRELDFCFDVRIFENGRFHVFFPCTFGVKSTKSLRTSFSAGACDLRRCTGRARSGLSATPWRTRRSPHPLFPRQTRVRTGGAASGGSIKQIAMHSGVFFPAWRFPTWFRWRKSGRRAESDSGGDGLLANPRSRPTPLSDFRTSTSESVGWLLLLFATEKQRKKSFSGSCKRTSRGFLLLFATEKQRKRKSFLVYFWGQKYQKPPHVVFRGSVRSAALHGARKIKPMRHPVADTPQPAPSFSASNESADWWCRRWQ